MKNRIDLWNTPFRGGNLNLIKNKILRAADCWIFFTWYVLLPQKTSYTHTQFVDEW